MTVTGNASRPSTAMRGHFVATEYLRWALQIIAVRPLREQRDDQIVWLYSPTSLCVRSTASSALNMSRMRASEIGLSTTTTSSGLFDDARTRPQVPSSTVTRTPLTVTRSRMPCPATLSPFFCAASKCATTWSTTPYLVSSAQCGDMVGDDQVFGSAFLRSAML